MTNDVQESIKDQIKQRLLDPLIGILIISTITYNWKIILILLIDSKPIIERISYIENVYFSTTTSYFNHFGTPFIFSVLWFFIFPHIRHFTSIYYTWSLIRTEKTNRDITNKINYMSRLETLEEINSKLQSIEQPLIQLYQQSKRGNPSYFITKCNGAEIGDWINNSDRIGKLAYQSKEKSIWAEGIVVEKFLNGYVLVQITGDLPWHIAGITLEKNPSGSLDFYLSSERGKMSLDKINTRYGSQMLGSSYIESNNVFFRINLKVTRDS